MNKYQEALIGSMKKQMSDWIDGVETPDREALDRFFHTLKGTAATIGLPDIAKTAEALQERLGANGAQNELKESLQELLYPLIKLAYEAECSAVEAPAAMEEIVDAPEYVPGQEPVILALDDDPTFLLYLKENLERLGWTALTSMDPEKAIAYIHDLRPDCFITDLNMPQQSGLEVLAALREKVRRRFIPTIVLSAHSDKAHRMESYRHGADDYLVKPLDFDELVIRIARLIDRKREMEQVAMIDSLTGAFMRSVLPEAYHTLDARLRRNREPFCLAMLDLDHFKQINDRYGHLTGDQVLRCFCESVKQNSRLGDQLIRYGGEEFALLMPNVGLPEAAQAVKRLLKAFSSIAFGEGETSFHVTFSGGIVEITESGKPCEHWIRLADQALYRAKSEGRNRILAVNEGEGEKPVAKKLHISIVDDDAIVRSVLTESLDSAFSGKAKLKIASFREGGTFLDSLEQSAELPSLVILDGVTPRIEGLELLDKLRQRKDSNRTYVMMLTHRTSERDIIRALELGADDYISKPFRLHELETKIGRLILRMLSHG